MTKLHDAVFRLLESREPSVLVEISAVHGSTPRETDAWMLVSVTAAYGTIGGGQLEFQAMETARNLLTGNTCKPETSRVPLGPQIGQCCGGVVDLLFRPVDEAVALELKSRLERECERRPDVYVFGAGHVGKALLRCLELLPVNAIAVETREDELEYLESEFDKRLTAMPETEVRKARAGSAFVIMTHDHALDFLIAREALDRGDAAYVGMIGSRTKRATFRNWLRRETGSEAGMKGLVCPIGGETVHDKRPEVIAALTTAEIVARLREAAADFNLTREAENPRIAETGG